MPMNYRFTPTNCRPQFRHTASASTPVRTSITDLSTVSSILQCAALACRTTIVQEQPPDFWCVADCLEIANNELWKAVEALQSVADRIEPDDTPQCTDNSHSAGEPDDGEANDSASDRQPDHIGTARTIFPAS